MARGWESKSVEAQQAEAGDKATKNRIKLSPEAAARQRSRENIRLSRQRVLEQLKTSQNPALRRSLETALAELNQKLNALETEPETGA